MQYVHILNFMVVIYFYFQHLKSKFEPSDVTFGGSVDKDSLINWIKTNYHGLTSHKTVNNAREFKEPLVLAYYDVDYVKNVKGTYYWRNHIMKVSQNFKSLNFAICNENDFQHEASVFGLGEQYDSFDCKRVKYQSQSEVIKVML